MRKQPFSWRRMSQADMFWFRRNQMWKSSICICRPVFKNTFLTRSDSRSLQHYLKLLEVYICSFCEGLCFDHFTSLLSFNTFLLLYTVSLFFSSHWFLFHLGSISLFFSLSFFTRSCFDFLLFPYLCCVAFIFLGCILTCRRTLSSKLSIKFCFWIIRGFYVFVHVKGLFSAVFPSTNSDLPLTPRLHLHRFWYDHTRVTAALLINQRDTTVGGWSPLGVDYTCWEVPGDPAHR